MIKKLNAIFTTLIMLIALPAMAYAQDEIIQENIQPIVTTSIEVESETNQNSISQRDVTDITVNNGAKVRVSQLQRSIKTNINGAENIILNLRETENQNIDFDKLYQIVNSLEVILIDLEEFDYNRPAQEMAREFSLHRSDAVSLTTEFRRYIHSITTPEQRDELRETYNQVREEVRNEFSQKLREEVKNQNLAHLRNLLNNYNLNTENIISQIENGEITIEQVRERLSLLASSISSEQRAEISQRASEDKTRQNIQARERVQEIQENLREQAEIRNERLQERLEDRAEIIAKRVSDRASPALIQNVNRQLGQQELEEAQRRIEALRNERLDGLNQKEIPQSHRGGGSGKVTVADFSFSSRTDNSQSRLNLYTTEEEFIMVEGDLNLVNRAEIFLKIEGVQRESRVNVDDDGFLITEVDNLRTATRAILTARGIQGEIPVIIVPKSNGNDRPTESLSFSFGKIKVTYNPQSSSLQEDSQQKCEVRDNDDLWCWGSGSTGLVINNNNEEQQRTREAQIESRIAVETQISDVEIRTNTRAE